MLGPGRRTGLMPLMMTTSRILCIRVKQLSNIEKKKRERMHLNWVHLSTPCRPERRSLLVWEPHQVGVRALLSHDKFLLRQVRFRMEYRGFMEHSESIDIIFLYHSAIKYSNIVHVFKLE